MIDASPSSSNYEVAFPPHFNIYKRLHALKLRPRFPRDDLRFPSRRFEQPLPDIEASDANNVEYVIESSSQTDSSARSANSRFATSGIHRARISGGRRRSFSERRRTRLLTIWLLRLLGER